MARPSFDETAHLGEPAERLRLTSQLSAFVAGAEGEYRVRLDPVVPLGSGRSNPQLRWYWGCIVKPLFAWMRANGWEVVCEDDAHDELRKKYLLAPLKRDRNGVPIRYRVRSTGELTAGEFSAYCDECRDLLAKYCGIKVDDPDPAWRENAERTKREARAAAAR